MSFISVFDVLGPNMIGPSSSHTAGAARIAYLAQKMINGPLVRVDFTLYGSFARTYRGHGTDRALLGGIMGFDTDDMRIRDSFRIAEERGIAFCFVPNEEETDVHPNTVDIHMVNAVGQEMTVRGESLGGGKARISRINGVDVDFTGEYSAWIICSSVNPYSSCIAIIKPGTIPADPAVGAATISPIDELVSRTAIAYIIALPSREPHMLFPDF